MTCTYVSPLRARALSTVAQGLEVGTSLLFIIKMSARLWVLGPHAILHYILLFVSACLFQRATQGFVEGSVQPQALPLPSAMPSAHRSLAAGSMHFQAKSDCRGQSRAKLSLQQLTC